MVVCLVAGVALGWSARADTEFRTCLDQPMQYYVSRPKGWSKDKAWPWIIVIDGAERKFEEALDEFVAARGERPYVVVAPCVVTDGGSNIRGAQEYRYSESTWDAIEKAGHWAFDKAGLEAVYRDVQRLDSAEPRALMYGFEAGGHTVWAWAFQRPETLTAVALVCPNFLGRHLDDASFSTDPSRATLPVAGFFGGEDQPAKIDGPFRTQWGNAVNVAQSHGFKTPTLHEVPGRGHVRLAQEVVAWFDALNHLR